MHFWRKKKDEIWIEVQISVLSIELNRDGDVIFRGNRKSTVSINKVEFLGTIFYLFVSLLFVLFEKLTPLNVICLDIFGT